MKLTIERAREIMKETEREFAERPKADAEPVTFGKLKQFHDTYSKLTDAERPIVLQVLEEHFEKQK